MLHKHVPESLGCHNMHTPHSLHVTFTLPCACQSRPHEVDKPTTLFLLLIFLIEQHTSQLFDSTHCALSEPALISTDNVTANVVEI